MNGKQGHSAVWTSTQSHEVLTFKEIPSLRFIMQLYVDRWLLVSVEWMIKGGE